MTRAKYPRDFKAATETAKSLKTGFEELSGSLEHWFKCRDERIQAQFRLIQSCRSDEDIERHKAQGLLNFDGPSL